MKVEMLPVEEIKPYGKNPRKIPPDAIDKVAESIRQFGFRQPIVVDEQNFIIVGHTRWMAAKRLGIPEVPVHVAKGLTEEQIKAYRLADNKVHEFSDWDTKLLDQELASLKSIQFDMSIFGFEDVSGPDKPNPQIEFGEVVMENHNYVLLVFDNDVDWLAAQTHFNLKPVSTRRSGGRPGTIGIGRVVHGGKYLTEIKGKMKDGV